MMKLPSVLLLLLLAPPMISCKTFQPVDCSDIHHHDNKTPSGVYTIYPIGSTSAVQVYCDMDSQGGRWTVFQRRMDGSVNFYRPWDQYKTGFGNAAGEYWLGLENIHQMTRQRNYELLVDMEDFEGKKVFARYSSFKVDAECDGYVLQVTGFSKEGGAGDGLLRHNGMKFSTFDKDQDIWSGNCAKSFLGGWWYDQCHSANPNGVYRWGADKTLYAVGVEWKLWKEHDYSLKAISMKIRPVK
ncbi:microfibril-associated glycoprotein 4-like isoform 1-T4 [Odontesthes bonariensis]|uniref:microfibril-associated glycoprotein 4-like n=1 Tax=Odontesthes bonariensis TaxID=219752 RepID=UPI003F5892C2